MFRMNAIIFKNLKEAEFLPFTDPRALHVRDVIKAHDGDEVFVGLANGNLGKTRVKMGALGCAFMPEWSFLPAPRPLEGALAVAFTRPQIAKRILFEAACAGVKKLCFYVSEKGFAPYLKSSLYESGEFEEQLYAGASQACATTIPDFLRFESLEALLKYFEETPAQEPCAKIAPDPYESTGALCDILTPCQKTHYKSARMVLGGERGFGAQDRAALRASGFALAGMGERVLRTDSAVIAALFAMTSFLKR